MVRLISVFSMILGVNSAFADEESLAARCERELLAFPGPATAEFVRSACAKTARMEGCRSVEGASIYHYDKPGTRAQAKKILVFSLIHGDETPAGSVGRYWMERLETIDPRNSWRVVPVLNPDGVQKKARTNANNVDLNRNFPTKDWNEVAQKLWKTKTQSNPRRFPGETGGSEPEVQCALKHIEDYSPDFIVSIHTPLKVLDFDGPKLNRKPAYDYLPWRSLGTFPGSLGRYMWFERRTPVLTMELADSLPKSYQPFERLQDIIGSLAILETDPENSPRGPSQLPGQRASAPAASEVPSGLAGEH